MRARHKKWTTPYLLEHPEIAINEITDDPAFFESAPLYLEIGIGKGDFILGMAKKHPGHYLGIEREADVLAIALKKTIEAEEKNIRLFLGDFDFLYEKIENLRFETIYLNFSDPWPKRRHWKRRLETHERLEKMKSLLVDKGCIIFKSDGQELYEFTLEEAPKAGFKIESSTNDYALLEEDVATEYEKNFREQGKPITRIVLRKE